jgi:hypothetical protein
MRWFEAGARPADRAAVLVGATVARNVTDALGDAMRPSRRAVARLVN